MEPMTRSELFMAAAAGEYAGDLPIPVTREDQYWQKVIQKIDAGSSVSPEQVDAAIADYLNTHDADIVTEAELSDALAGKVDKETGKGLTDINYSADEQAKVTAAYEARHTHDNKAVLDGITEAKVRTWDAAQPNVNADWNVDSGDARILNKPDLSVYAREDDMTAALGGKVDKETNKSLMSADEHTKLNGIETGAQVNTVIGVKGNAENNYRTGEINISPANIGLGNVDNTSDANKPISTAAQTALDGKQDVLTFDNSPTESSENPVKSGGVYSALAGKISISAKGANGGVAELDANGKIPSSQMPSSVDNILEYPTLNDFPATGEDRKIYIALDTKLTYRWGGTEYGEISPSIALGTTSSTAYRGDWGAEDRAAIGTLTDLQTTAKSNLVSAVNEVKTALGNVQGTLTFDNVPTSGSGNPVKSGGIYTALAGKQDTLTIDSAPTSGSDNPVKSGGVYTALSGKQNTLTFDSTPTENSTNPVTSGGLFSALSGKVDAEANKGLSTNDYTTAEKTKLGGIESGAEANVQSDWNQSDTTADDFIKNKPTNASASAAGLMSAADKAALNALKPVILWSGASVANTITLNESVAGYDMVEVVGALDTSGFWSMSGKGIVNNGEVLALGLCSVKGGWTGVGLDIDGCMINISGSTLTRGSALPSSVTGGDSREIHLNATPSGSTLALTMNTGSNGAYNITILRVIGYKAVSA